MSVIDRVESAKHTIVGSPIGKAVAKATSREIIGPKKKHVDYLQMALNYDNVSIPSLVDMLFERTQNSSWIVTFKGLITFHHLMSNGNERFVQCLASRTSTWMLQNFLDKNGVQGYDMSHAIRRYSHYLSEKAFIYRTMGYDFCRIQRGKTLEVRPGATKIIKRKISIERFLHRKENGVLRNMDTVKLVKALPEIQKQLDALLSTDISGNELTNGVITAAFMLLFKDSIRLFACYNDGIINLLEQYFDMKKADCKVALEIYKKFVNRMDRVSAFLKVAEDVGIDRGDIPDLTQAPSSLLTALENHMQSLEKGKALPPSKPITLPAFNVNSTVEAIANPFGTDTFDDKETASDDALEHERQALRNFERQKQASIKAPALAPPLAQTKTVRKPPQSEVQQPQPQQELLLNQAPLASPPQSSAASDLLALNNSLLTSGVQANIPRSSTFPMAVQKPGELWTPQATPWTQQDINAASPVTTNPFNTTANNNNTAFSPVFQSSSGQNGDVLLGDLLTPEPIHEAAMQQQQQTQILDNKDPGDLSSSLARAARSLDDLSINASMQRAQTQKGKHQWKPQQQQVKTGGANYQSIGLAKTSIPPVASQQSGWAGATGPQLGMQAYPGQAQMRMQPQYGNNPAPAMMPGGINNIPMQSSYNQMAMQSQDPFGSIPGAQVRF